MIGRSLISRRFLSSATSTAASKSVQTLPKLAVFDLDHTVWPLGVDSYKWITPFHHNSKGQVIDMSSKVIEHFPDIKQIFKYLADKDIQIGLASRTQYPTGAKSLLEKLGLTDLAQYSEIYPGQKMKHFERISKESGIPFNEMIFFDDEPRNIEDIGALGVFSVLVPRETGVTMENFTKALEEFGARK